MGSEMCIRDRNLRGLCVSWPCAAGVCCMLADSRRKNGGMNDEETRCERRCGVGIDARGERACDERFDGDVENDPEWDATALRSGDASESIVRRASRGVPYSARGDVANAPGSASKRRGERVCVTSGASVSSCSCCTEAVSYTHLTLPTILRV